MKTEDLVRSLAMDAVVDRRAAGRAAAVGYPVCLLVLAVSLFAVLGLRPGMGTSQVMAITAMKLGITVTMAVTGVIAVFKAAQPDADLRAIALAAAPTLVLLAMAIVFDLATSGIAGWQARATGLYGWNCVLAVSTLSLVPLATTLFVLRRGAVTRQTMAGAVAGLAATGIGASFYALHCTDDSPLFMLVWYGAATLIVVLMGILGARRFLSW